MTASANEKNEPTIEPPCDDCLHVRKLSGNKEQWCARHSKERVHGHAFTYQREIPLAQHDSAVAPTGVDVTNRRGI